MEKTNTVITIGRQFGSAGREIGYKVAKDLGIKLYDKEMLDRAAKESGICQELSKHMMKNLPIVFYIPWLWTRILWVILPEAIRICRLIIKYFLPNLMQLKKLQMRVHAFWFGRCADYALEEYDNVLSVFIHADLNARIRRIARIYDLTDAKAKDMINKTDKKRSSYYNYYTNKRWGDAVSYDVSLNSSLLGIDGTAEAIKRLVEIKENNNNKKL